jgi:hypothetical protein
MMEGSGAGSVLEPTDPDADPGGKKIYGSEVGSISTTLDITNKISVSL